MTVPVSAVMKPSPAGQVFVLPAVQLAEKVEWPGSQLGGSQEQVLVSASQRLQELQQVFQHVPQHVW